MPRDLAEVLHFFLPEAESEAGSEAGNGTGRGIQGRPAPAPAGRILTLPFSGEDLVRSALFWNLAVAAARRTSDVRVVTVPGAGSPPLAAGPGRGPLGLEVLHAARAEPAALVECARSAAAPARTAGQAGLVLVALPSEWLARPQALEALLAWVVVLMPPEPHEMLESYAALKRAARAAPAARLGACIFGVQRLEQASRAFDRLALTVDRHLGRELTSYGMLIDDVQLSRSIVNRRPIALAYPSAPSARALDDVAALLLEDA